MKYIYKEYESPKTGFILLITEGMLCSSTVNTNDNGEISLEDLGDIFV